MQTHYWHLDKDNFALAELEEAATLLRQGEVVAFPTETVYGLGANGLDATACRKIYEAKGRPADNPLILHIAEVKELEPLTTKLSASARRLAATFWPGPMTLIVPRSSIVSDIVTAGLDTVAVRLPDHPIAHALIELAGVPIAAPSANKSGRPSPTKFSDVVEDMAGRVAGIIDGGECRVGVESTIIDTTTVIPTILRPGGITREMLMEAVGEVELDPGLVEAGRTPKAPGMKYRHYAPQATMYIVEGPEAAQLWPRLARSAVAQGLKCGLLYAKSRGENYQQLSGTIAYSYRDGEALAHELFKALRALDRKGVDIIIAQGISEEGIGLAVMNRMRKAAGKNIYWAENGILTLYSGQIPTFCGTIV